MIALGLRMCKWTESHSHDGYDGLIKEKHFHFKQLFVWCVEDEAMALKLRAGLPPEER